MAFRKVATVDDLWSGEMKGFRVHEWQYDIATGRGVNPASAFLRPFPVKVEARQIFVDLPEDEPGE